MNSNESSRPLGCWGQKYRLATKSAGDINSLLKVPRNLLKSGFILLEEFLITLAVLCLLEHLSVTQRDNLD